MKPFISYVALVSFAVGAASPASGQWADGLERPWMSQITRDEVASFKDALALSEEQLTTFEVMITDHAEAFAILANQGKARIIEIDKRNTTSLTQVDRETLLVERARATCEWADRLADLDFALVEDLQLILEEEQQERWEAYLRDKRWRMLDQFQTTVPGVKVNLKTLIAAMDLSQEETDTVAATLNDYNTMMDGLLEQMFSAAIRTARRDWRESDRQRRINEKQRKIAAEGGDSYDGIGRAEFFAIQREYRDSLAPQVVVRQTNEQFANLMLESLAEGKREAFSKLLHQATYPNVFVRSRADVYLNKPELFLNLDESHRLQTQELLTAHEQRVKTLNEQLVALEEQAFHQFWKNPTGHLALAEIHKKSALIRDKRNELETQLVDNVSKLLEEDDSAIESAPAIDHSNDRDDGHNR